MEDDSFEAIVSLWIVFMKMSLTVCAWIETNYRNAINKPTKFTDF